MTADQIIEALAGLVPHLHAEIATSIDQPTLLLPRDEIVAACTALRDLPATDFKFLSDITCVDWWPGEPRFQVVYHLASVGQQPKRLRLKVPVAGDDAHVPTLSEVWPAANWLEREVYDLFGIVFDNHPDLRRLLMPDDWEGHPLRKDYPVQIELPVKIYEPLQMTPEEFKKKIEADRYARGKTAR